LAGQAYPHHGHLRAWRRRRARIIAEPLSKALGQSVVAENRGGGIVAATQVARAEPDGYTILMGGLAPQILAPAMPAPMRSATSATLPICRRAADRPGGAAVERVAFRSMTSSRPRRPTNSPAMPRPASARSAIWSWNTWQSATTSSSPTFPTTPRPSPDIIAGRVPMGLFTWGAALGQVQGGTSRALAVTTEARRPEAPDVPTFKELGYDLVASTWFSFSGPKGLPKEIVQRLNQETIRIWELPEVKKRVIQDPFDPKPLTAEQLAAFMETETARWTPIAQEAMKK
jgi:tripartite-type tricarboxylate transporter receptor subunit TctC